MEKLLNEFSLGLFFWQTLLFTLLLWLLWKFAWKPILSAVNEREEGIRNALASAEEAKKEMQNITADSEKLLKEAREIKEKMISDAKEQALLESDTIIKQAQTAIESEKKAAVADIKEQVANLSIHIAEKILKEELSDKKKQLKVVEALLGDVKLN